MSVRHVGTSMYGFEERRLGLAESTLLSEDVRQVAESWNVQNRNKIRNSNFAMEAFQNFAFEIGKADVGRNSLFRKAFRDGRVLRRNETWRPRRIS